MKISKRLLLAVIPMACLAVSMQAEDNAPQKGDFTVAATLGYNSYTSINALSGTLGSYEATAIATNWADKKIMVGFEGGWFVSDAWKLTLGGGLNFTKNPGYTGVPGTWDSGSAEDNMGNIPDYRAIADASSFSYNVFAGADRYFAVSKVSNLFWYAGGRVGMAYAQNQMKYDEPESMGKSVAETWNLRVAGTMGIDYFVLPSMFVGVQIDPVCYTYNMTTYKPQEGLSNLDADSHSFSFLAAPTIKIGFKF